jgi:16S rRNA (guanine527-N7)-methyltransferase
VNAEEFAAEANVSRETLEKLVQYQKVLEKWQPRINLVGPATLPDAWSRHFLDSAQLYPLLAAHLKTRSGRGVLFDLGSGAGFPGLVLAIVAAGAGHPLEVHLVDSDKRKAAFLGEVARATGQARGVTIHATRVANLPLERLPRADIVTARAVAPLPDLLNLTAPLLAPHGIGLFLKGAQAAAELTRAAKDWTMRVERIASRTDPSGTILRVADLTRV